MKSNRLAIVSFLGSAGMTCCSSVSCAAYLFSLTHYLAADRASRSHLARILSRSYEMKIKKVQVQTLFAWARPYLRW